VTSLPFDFPLPVLFFIASPLYSLEASQLPPLFILYYLSPLIPLSFEGEGEEVLKRGFAPLKLP
jgi:hypothetical protein